MAFSNEIKTILRIDGKDWEKSIKSISDAEKAYFEESSKNTDKLINSKEQLANIEAEHRRKIISLNKEIRESEKQLTKDISSNDENKIKSTKELIELKKRELESSIKSIDQKRAEVKNTQLTIYAINEYSKKIRQAKLELEQLGITESKYGNQSKITSEQLIDRLIKNKQQISLTKELTEQQKALLFQEQKRVYAEKEAQNANKITSEQLKEKIRLSKLDTSVKPTQSQRDSFAQEIANQNKLHYAELERIGNVEEEKKRAYEKEKANFAEQYKNTYELTSAQIKYNDAKKRLDGMLTSGAISQEQYNKGLATEGKLLKENKGSYETATNAVVRHLRQIETLIVSYYMLKGAWDATIGVGIRVNRMMEDNANGIAALLSANTAMTLSNGKAVTSYQKFSMGQAESIRIMEKLRIASIKTYATFPQLTEIFQQAYGQALSMGDGLGKSVEHITDNTIKLSQRMSNIAGAIGMPMDRVKEEVRSLLSGNASTDSLISTMIFGSPGQANEAINKAKEKGGGAVKDLLDKMLEPFDALENIDSYTKNLLELQDAYQNTMKVMSEPIYHGLADTFKILSKALNDNKGDLIGFGDTFGDVLKQVNSFGSSLGAVFGSIISVADMFSSDFKNVLKTVSMAVQFLNNGMLVAANGLLEIKSISQWITRDSKGMEETEKIIAKNRAMMKSFEEIVNDAQKLGEKSKKRSLLEITSGINIDKTSLKELQGTRATLLAMTKGDTEAQEALLKWYQTSTLQIKAREEGVRLQNKFVTSAMQKALEEDKELTKQARGEIALIEDDIKKRVAYIDKLKNDLKTAKGSDKESVQQAIDEFTKGNIARANKIAEINKKESTKASSILNTEEKEKFNLKSLENEVNLQAEILGATYKTSKEIVSLKAMEYDAIEKLRINNFDLEEEALIEKLALANEIKDSETRQANQDKIKADILQNLIKKEEYLLSLKTKSNDEVQKSLDLEQKRRDDIDALINKYTIKKPEDELGLKERLDANKIAYDNAVKAINGTSDEAKKKLLELDEVFKKSQERFKNENLIKQYKEDMTIDIKLNGFDEVSNSIASLTNGFIDMNNSLVEYNSTMADISKSDKEKAKAQQKYATDTVGAYGNMAGAIGSFYEEGSTQAKNFQKVQQAMYMAQMAMQMSALLTQTATSGASIALMGAETTVAVTLAVAKQAGAGDPYTAFARVVAMAALLASFGIIVGGALSGGDKTSTSYDSLSAIKANEGKGTVLGDAEAGSNSIANSLEILSDLAKPEYSLIAQMNKSLISIDNKIGGVTTMLLRNAGFALGEGYTGFDTGYSNNINTSGLGDLNLFDKLTGSTIVSGILDSVVGGIFGKSSTSQKLTDAGLIFGEQLITKAKEDFEGSAYQTIATTVSKKSWFSSSSSTSYATYTQGMDEEIRNQFELILGGMYDSVIATGDMLEESKQELADRLSDYTVKLGKISLMGKTGSEMQELLSNVFGKTIDEMVTEAYAIRDFTYETFDKTINDFKDITTNHWWSGEQVVIKTAETQLSEAQSAYEATKSAAHTAWLETTATTLDGFIKVGETISTTLTRVSSGMEEAEYFIDRLGYQFEDIDYKDIINQQGEVGVEALKQSLLNYEEAYYNSATGIDEIVQVLTGTTEEVYNSYTSLQNLRLQIGYTGQSINGLTTSMVSGAGGIDNLSSGVSSYFENFYTEAQQSRLLTRQVSEEFKKLNLTMPESKDGFRLMVDSIDLSTSSGQELYGRLITLSDGFVEAIDSADSLIEKEKELSNERIIAFSKSFDPFLNALKSIKDMAQSTSDSLGKQDIRAFWELDDEYQKLMRENRFEEAQAVFSKISSLSGTLTSENEGLKAGIASYMEDITKGATSKETEINKSLMSGIGSLYNLTTEQLKVLQSVGADGSITNAELESLTFATDDLKTTLIDAGFVETNTILGSIEEYSRLQLAELQDANAMETSSLSTDTFKYLDYLGKKEQYDIASSLGKSFADVEDFIYQIQSFDIKDSIQDLEEMKSLIGYSFNTETGLVSYDQSKVTDLSKIWDVLPKDVKNAYSALSGLATSQQSGYLSGKNTALGGLNATMTKEQQDVITTSDDIASELSAIMDKQPNKYRWVIDGEGNTSLVIDEKGTDAGIFSGQSWDAMYYALASKGLAFSNYVSYSLDDNSAPVNIGGIEQDLLKIIVQEQGLLTEQTQANTATTQYNYLLKLINSYKATALPSFDVGSAYIPNDMIAQVHQSEMIIDPQSSDVLRKYGIKVNTQTPANNLTTNENKGIIEAINKQTEEVKKLNARMEKIELLNKDTRDNTERMAIGA